MTNEDQIKQQTNIVASRYSEYFRQVMVDNPDWCINDLMLLIPHQFYSQQIGILELRIIELENKLQQIMPDLS